MLICGLFKVSKQNELIGKAVKPQHHQKKKKINKNRVASLPVSQKVWAELEKKKKKWN